MRTHASIVAAVSIMALSGTAMAWDAVGHRAITWLALDGLPADAPKFLSESSVRDGIAWQSAEPDRWRGINSPILRHENAPEHFLDIEDLEAFGLTLETINPLRMRFIRDVAIARHVHPTGPNENYPPYNEKLDPAGDKEWPGFALHAVVEHHGKLTSHFKTLRTLEAINDPSRAAQVAQTKANIAFTMGVMSHYVGDLAQPLHTTKHFNGWVGENPQNYTVAKTFHAYIDGGVLFLHGLDYHTLKATQTFTATIDPSTPWPATVAYVRRSHEQVEPLYILEKSGELDKAEGKAFITRQLNDGANMLAAYYASAWKASEITQRDIDDFQRYDSFSAGQRPSADAAEMKASHEPLKALGELKEGRRVLLAGTIAPAGSGGSGGDDAKDGGKDGNRRAWVLKLSDTELFIPSFNGHRPLREGAVIVQGRVYEHSSRSGTKRWAISVEDWKAGG